MSYKITPHGKKFRIAENVGGKVIQHKFDDFQTATQWRLLKLAEKAQPEKVDVDTDLKQLIEEYVYLKYSYKSPDIQKNCKSMLSITLPKINWKKPTLAMLKYCIKDYKSSTAREHLKHVRGFIESKNIICDFKWKDLFRGITRDDRKPKHWISKEEFEKICNSVPEKYKLIYRIMAFAGMRVYELCRLNVSQFDKNSFKIVLAKGNTKTKKERSFFVPNEIREDFLKHSNCNNEDKNAPLFAHDGIRISRQGLSAAFKDHCERLGMTKEAGNNKNIHLLRAYALELMYEAGAPEHLIKLQAGWDSEVMGRYVSGKEDEKQELARNVSYSNEKTDTTLEMMDFTRFLDAVVPKEKRGAISQKSGVSIAWMSQLCDKKENQHIANLLAVMKAVRYQLTVRPLTRGVEYIDMKEQLGRDLEAMTNKKS